MHYGTGSGTGVGAGAYLIWFGAGCAGCAAVTVMCSEFRYNVTKFVTKSDGTFLGCCAGQDEPARSVPSVSHDGTDPPNVTFEARLPTFTLPLILSGRLSQLGNGRLETGIFGLDSGDLRSAAAPAGSGPTEGRDAERLRTGSGQLRWGAPRCRGRPHRAGSCCRCDVCFSVRAVL